MRGGFKLEIFLRASSIYANLQDKDAVRLRAGARIREDGAHKGSFVASLVDVVRCREDL